MAPAPRETGCLPFLKRRRITVSLCMLFFVRAPGRIRRKIPKRLCLRDARARRVTPTARRTFGENPTVPPRAARRPVQHRAGAVQPPPGRRVPVGRHRRLLRRAVGLRSVTRRPRGRCRPSAAPSRGLKTSMPTPQKSQRRRSRRVSPPEAASECISVLAATRRRFGRTLAGARRRPRSRREMLSDAREARDARGVGSGKRVGFRESLSERPRRYQGVPTFRRHPRPLLLYRSICDFWISATSVRPSGIRRVVCSSRVERTAPEQCVRRRKKASETRSSPPPESLDTKVRRPAVRKRGEVHVRVPAAHLPHVGLGALLRVDDCRPVPVGPLSVPQSVEDPAVVGHGGRDPHDVSRLRQPDHRRLARRARIPASTSGVFLFPPIGEDRSSGRRGKKRRRTPRACPP